MNGTPTADSKYVTRVLARSMNRLERRFEATADNLANAETAGHKRLVSRSSPFEAALDRAGDSGGRDLIRDFTQGPVVATGDPRQLALEGPGFFAVEIEGEIAFTRSVTLHVDPTGVLVDQRGARLLGEGGPLQAPDGLSNTQISADGEVETAGQSIGRLRVVEFEEPEKLRKIAGGVFVAPDDQDPQAVTATRVRGGYHERSNVNSLVEMVEMIAIRRQHEAAGRAMNAWSDLRRNLHQNLLR